MVVQILMDRSDTSNFVFDSLVVATVSLSEVLDFIQYRYILRSLKEQSEHEAELKDSD